MIEFNRPYLTNNELNYISEAHTLGKLSGDGEFTRLCSEWFETKTGCVKALLVHSCTAALEMAAILADIKPGDEVIMPSYTFVSTANAFVLRGGVPVFVDIRPDTLNIDESLIESAITSRTKVIVPVHYAGIACEMDIIMEIARRHDLLVIEDAAQGLMSSYKGKALGSIGDMGCYSFHETKNIISGEGGALLINNPILAERAEIIREKGTNRKKFFRGQVDKYSWVDIGSSYLPGEITAAFLWAQLEKSENITNKRIEIWERYYNSFAELENTGRIQSPIVPLECSFNAHMFYLILRDFQERSSFIQSMNERGIKCLFHYIPLHSSPYGLEKSRVFGCMDVTNNLSSRLVRLPIWLGVEKFQEYIIDSVKKHFEY